MNRLQLFVKCEALSVSSTEDALHRNVFSARRKADAVASAAGAVSKEEYVEGAEALAASSNEEVPHVKAHVATSNELAVAREELRANSKEL